MCLWSAEWFINADLGDDLGLFAHLVNLRCGRERERDRERERGGGVARRGGLGLSGWNNGKTVK